MKRRNILISALLALSFLAPIQLTSSAFAESKNVMVKGWLIKPSMGGAATETYCPAGMAAVGITISTTLEPSRPYLQDFRIKCLDSPIPAKGKSYSAVTRTFVSQSPGNTSVRDEYCPSGSVLIGLKMATEAYVRDIAPVCAQADTGVITLNADVGSGTGESVSVAPFAAPKTSMCPILGVKQSYVIGIDGFAAAGVDAIRVLCGVTLKGRSSQNLPVGEILLAQYLPKGLVSSSGSLPATSTTSYINFSSLTQVGGDATSNTDVFPFRTSTTTASDPNHYFQFAVNPASSKVSVKITRLTYASLSYPLGSGPASNPITGKPASSFEIKYLRFGSGRSIPSTIGSVNLEFNRDALTDFPAISSSTTVQIGFHNGTGVQYNDLSGRDGATGMMIYGHLIDNSPVVPEEPAVAKAPDAPTNFTFIISKGVALISVDVPKSLIGSVDRNNFALISPKLGYSETNKLIAGSVDKGKAYFKLKLQDINLGKAVSFRIATLIDSIESAPLLKTVQLPKLVTTTPTPKATATPKSTPKATPKVIAPKPTTIQCAKAGVTRTFTGTTCPPGYTKR